MVAARADAEIVFPLLGETIVPHLPHLCHRFSDVCLFGRKGIPLRTLLNQLIDSTPVFFLRSC